MTRQPVFVLRPEPGLTATLVAAFGRGIEARGMPLGTVEAVPWRAPAKPFDGLLVGSANAIRHAGGELQKLLHLPVYCVGEATAQAAREAGLTVERVGTGGLQAVLDALEGSALALLRLAGERHLALTPPPGVSIDRQIVYRTVDRAMTSAQASALAHGATVLLHSGETAAHFARECDRLGVDRTQVTLIAMAPRIARMAGQGWRALHTAPAPNDAALLEMAAELCQKRSG